MKAVIEVSGKQYIVAEKESLLVDRLAGEPKELTLEPLMVFDGNDIKLGTPTLQGVVVTAKVDEPEVKGEKLRIAHFESKKRVKNISGHRQKHSKITITKIG